MVIGEPGIVINFLGMNHKDMDVWKKSMDLVEAIYKISAQFPKEEVYGLTSQIRRSAVSVPSNVAEESDTIKNQLISVGKLVLGTRNYLQKK